MALKSCVTLQVGGTLRCIRGLNAIALHCIHFALRYEPSVNWPLLLHIIQHYIIRLQN